MLTNTESGSGGSRAGVITGFEDGGDEDEYFRQLLEVWAKTDDLMSAGEIASLESAKRPGVDWLGLQALRPSLDLFPPSEAAIFITPIPEMPEENSWHNRNR